MTKARTIADLLESGRTAGMAGRDHELSLLETLVAPEGPAVAYLHGPYGIGKSRLLGAFDALLMQRRIDVIRLSGGDVEPQPAAVTAALAAAAGVSCASLAEFAGMLIARGRPVVVAIDDVDALRLVATWLRRELAPALPAQARLALAGRLPPAAAWTAEYGELFMALPLRPLEREAVLTMARQAGLDGVAAENVWELSAGHPLSMRMAMQAARTGLLTRVGAAGDLALAIIAGADDPALTRMTEAAAVVRRVTRPIMAAMLGDNGLDGFDGFAAMPFVQLDREGYLLSEPVRRTLAARLASIEPERYSALRLAAASWITSRLTEAGPEERWRYMADLLHFVENPIIRDAFFPPDTVSPPVEPARHDDFCAVLDIAEARAGAGERRIMECWAQVLPHRFSVARAPKGEVLAFYVCARDDDPLDGVAATDPLLAAWCTHAERNRAPGGKLFLRQLLATDPSPNSPAWSACTLDVKRIYFERWNLSRVYTVARAETIEGPFMRRLGFRPLIWPRDGLPGSMVLDLPGAGLIGWISALVDVTPAPHAMPELGFARDRREIAVDGKVVQLTRLEADLLAKLIDRAPAVVSREELIETVWQRAFVGSNVVDAVVRTLRRKLGSASGRIGTVPKAGYRYRR